MVVLGSFQASKLPSWTCYLDGNVINPFLFDHILYEPDASAILDNATVMVDAYDFEVRAYNGWIGSQVGWNSSVQGSYLTFDFVGAFRLKFPIFLLTILILCRYPSNMDNSSPFKSEHHCKCFGPI